MNTRKIVLLSAIAVLAVIYTVQVVTGTRSSVKIYNLDKAPDVLTVSAPDSRELTLSFDGQSWLINQDMYKADTDKTQRLIDSIKKVKTLGIITKSPGDEGRYGLDPQTRVTVRAYSQDKLTRTLYIGKEASAANQVYIKLDDSDTIYLCSGNLNAIFNQSEDDLKAVEKETDTNEEDGKSL